MNDQTDGTWPPIPPGSEPSPPPSSTEPSSAEPTASTWGQNYKPETDAPASPGAAYGGSSATGPTPRAVRPIRGPKFSGGGIPGGLGILALLITVVIMALMGAKVFSAMGGDTKSSSARDSSDDVVLPGGVVVPGDIDAGGGNLDPKTGQAATAAARAQACQVDKNTLETAISAFEAITGGPPADQQALVEEQILKAPFATQTFRIVDGEAVVEGAGDCA